MAIQAEGRQARSRSTRAVLTMASVARHAASEPKRGRTERPATWRRQIAARDHCARHSTRRRPATSRQSRQRVQRSSTPSDARRRPRRPSTRLRLARAKQAEAQQATQRRLIGSTPVRRDSNCDLRPVWTSSRDTQQSHKAVERRTSSRADQVAPRRMLRRCALLARQLLASPLSPATVSRPASLSARAMSSSIASLPRDVQAFLDGYPGQRDGSGTDNAQFHEARALGQNAG